MSAIQALLNGVIDYAGLFPPARLEMRATVENYAKYRRGPFAALLGRIIVPLARLDEFESLAQPIGGRWPISVVGNATLDEDLQKIEAFNRHHADAGDMQILSLESPLPSLSEMAGVEIAPDNSFEIFFEIGAEDRPAAERISDVNVMAKIRTGGVQPEAFPTVGQVATFVRTCHELGLTFKATAGLHHPLRATRPVTAEPAAPQAEMHGFLNLFLASAMLDAGSITVEQLPAILADRHPAAFEFDQESASWHDHSISIAQIELARQRAIRSFGSCSFMEPLEDLLELGWL